MLGSIHVPAAVVVLGAITGMTYGILAVGLVLVYRSSRIINFAHGEIGALGASLLGLLVVRAGVPYWLAFLAALLLSAIAGGASEMIVVRRLRSAPPIMTIVATLGLAEFLLSFSLLINGQVAAGTSFPEPSFLPTFNVGALTVTPAYSGMLILTPILVVALTIFLRKSRFGLAIRAASDDRDAARLAGVFAGRMSTLAWAIAGVVAAFTVILVLPTVGFANSEFLGPGLLMRALTAAVIARMVSIPIALVAGIGLGIVEQVVLWNYPSGGQFEAILFIVILVALLLQRRQFGRTDDRATWVAVQPWRRVPEAFQKVWAIRNLSWITAGVLLGAALLLPLVITNASSLIFIIIISFAIVGLSVGVITGLGGQLTLGQFALAGVGATASYYVINSTGSWELGFICGGLAAAAASLVIGMPALRIRGIMLAVVTLGFALAASDYFFSQSWTLGSGVSPQTISIGGFALDTAKKYYYFALIILVLAVLLGRNVWSGGVGLRLRAQRDNDDGARAFAVRTTAVKLQGFLLAGFIAGIGGALYGQALSTLGADGFPVQSSIDSTAMTALGGIALLGGPLLGALYIIGIPQFLPLDSAGTAATALGWLFVILYFPGGIAQMIRPVREVVINRLARMAGIDASAEWAASTPAATDFDQRPALLQNHRAPPPEGAELVPVLKVEGVRKAYGGLVAVDEVSLEVHAGETVGLIGPNGAGKTTLLELIAGFLQPDQGDVYFEGSNVTSHSAARRAGLGLVRSFQTARLFPTLTVEETVILAMERQNPTRFFQSVLGLHALERRKTRRAGELIALMGLTAWRHVQIQHLSTGTRRVTELACLMALNPSVLLLDEPSAGIAQKETEALGQLLSQLKEHLGVTMIIVEHDMPMLMGISKRILAMESGRIIADGTPEAVRSDPRVLESYLGAADATAIARSGELVAGNPAPEGAT
jgi:ABC-type branched-subunit amino acid transport system ATPase component/ABC-type branched-subunit amino acid transport system permease subunit